MRGSTAFGAALAAVVALSACGETAGHVPDYEIVSVHDLSYGDVRRLEVRVATTSHISRAEALRLAEAVVSAQRAEQALNAASILIFGPGTSTEGSYDIASVDWAPGGSWSDAGSVATGDYSKHEFSVAYIPALHPSSDVPGLISSGSLGLLDTPLPEGAELVDRTAADPPAGREPSEQYVIDATAAEIMAFFGAVMPDARWERYGQARDTGVFFRKGDLMIGVLTNTDGGSFTLMGS